MAWETRGPGEVDPRLTLGQILDELDDVGHPGADPQGLHETVALLKRAVVLLSRQRATTDLREP